MFNSDNPNRRRNILLAVMAVLAVLFLCCAAFAYAGYMLYQRTATDPAPQSASAPAPKAEAPEPECDGCNWQIDDTTKTMTWNGPTSGVKDIHQGTNTSIVAVRAGYTTSFKTDVPGEVIITIGELDGTTYVTETRVKVSAGKHVVKNSTGLSGGFRWTPSTGYGWRK